MLSFQLLRLSGFLYFEKGKVNCGKSTTIIYYDDYMAIFSSTEQANNAWILDNTLFGRMNRKMLTQLCQNMKSDCQHSLKSCLRGGIEFKVCKKLDSSSSVLLLKSSRCLRHVRKSCFFYKISSQFYNVYLIYSVLGKFAFLNVNEKGDELRKEFISIHFEHSNFFLSPKIGGITKRKCLALPQVCSL